MATYTGPYTNEYYAQQTANKQQVTTPTKTTVKKPVAKPATTTAVSNPNNLTPEQLKAGYSTIPGPYDPVTGKLKVSTTTLSNENKMETVPKLQNQLLQYENKGISTNPQTGVATYADGSAVDDGMQKEVPADTTQEDKARDELINSMQSTLDADTKALIDNIKQKFEQRRIEQRDINTRQQKGIQSALLMGGVTGQGSSAQFAPISSEGIIGAQESYGLKQIAELDSQEQDLIAEAKAAQSTGNFKIMEKKLTQIEEKRTEKIEAAKVLNEAIRKQNEKIREQNIQASRDQAIADLYTQGVTDVASMLEVLGEDFTSKEVKATLDNIVPPGLNDLVNTLRKNGAPPEVIQKVLSSGNINQAYANAGEYASEMGSGIVGEYNFYKQQALQAGQVPMDFNAYQDMDANRKKSIARAGASIADTTGMTPKQTQNFLSITTKFQADPFINNAIKGSTAIAIADQVLANPESAANQLKSLYVLVKNLDPDSAVREGEISLADKTQSYLDRFKTSFARISEGRVISPKAAKELAQATKELAGAWSDTAQRRQKQYKAQAAGVGIADAFNEYITGSDISATTASDLVQSGDQAKQVIDTKFDSLSTEIQDKITAMYDSGFSDIDVYEQLQARGVLE